MLVNFSLKFGFCLRRMSKAGKISSSHRIDLQLFEHWGKSLMYIRKTRGPRIPWSTHRLLVLQLT